jgi:hypothetical protein
VTSGPPLTIPLQGGLGNQLFELAAGLALAARTGRRIVFNDHWLNHPAPGETPRHYALDGLLTAAELAHSPMPRAASRLDIMLRRRVRERTADDDALSRVRRRTNLVAGYFQRLGYVDEVWNELARRLRTSAQERHTRLVASVSKACYGAVHYRLGDYVHNAHASDFHGVTPPSYFAALIAEHRNERGLDEWWVVSDEPEVAIELIGRDARLPRDVRLSVGGSDEWDDLATLSGATVLGISNSSFSWWAGYVAERERSAHVVAPRPWFADAATREPPLFPPTWQRLERGH